MWQYGSVAVHYNTAIKVRRFKVMGYILDIGVGVMNVQDKPSKMHGHRYLATGKSCGLLTYILI